MRLPVGEAPKQKKKKVRKETSRAEDVDGTMPFPFLYKTLAASYQCDQ